MIKQPTKGVILAGGQGSRLWPMTMIQTKQLQTVYDKPMIYYPLCTLMEAGIREIMLITTQKDQQQFWALLGDGSQLGIHIEYATQDQPRGIAEAILLSEEFVAGHSMVLILGDNIFQGELGLKNIVKGFDEGALIFGYHVRDPERYGVLELSGTTVIGLEEKPVTPRSNLAVPGLYIYDGSAARRTRELVPSARQELEITCLNNHYLRSGCLRALVFGRGIAWLDCGCPRSLLDASNYIGTLEQRQGSKTACPEELAFKSGWITQSGLHSIIDKVPKGSSYRQYLSSLLENQI